MKQSQKAVILKALQGNKWVSLSTIMSLKSNKCRIASYRRRISDLREDGYKIKNITIFNKKRKVNESAYILS